MKKEILLALLCSTAAFGCAEETEGEVLRYHGVLGGEVGYSLEIVRVELSKPEKICKTCGDRKSYAEFVLHFDRLITARRCCENVPLLRVGGRASGSTESGEGLEALVFQFAPDAEEGPIAFLHRGTDLPIKDAGYRLPFAYDREATPVIRR